MSDLHITNRRRILTNAAANWLSFAATVAITFYMAPRLVHGLGDRAYGVWALVESIVAYLALFDLGIGAAVVRFVARFEETKQREELNRVFSTSFAIFGLFGLAALAITFGLAFASAAPLGVPADFAADARGMLLLLGVNLAIGLPMGVYDAVLCALGRFPQRTFVQVAILLVRSGSFLVILAQGGGLLAIGWAITITTTAQWLILAVVARRALPELRFSRRFVDAATFRTIRGYSLWAFVAMIAGKLSFSTDAIVISAFLTPEYITYFAIGARLTEYCRMGVRAATSVLTPTISALDAQGDLAAIQRVMVYGTRAVLWIILPIEAGLILLGHPFLVLWMGQEIADASFLTLAILAAPLFLTLSQSISGRIVYGTGQLRWFACMTLAEGVVNLAVSLLLVGSLGIVGVAIGTTVPHIAFNVACAWYVCRLTRVSISSYLVHAFAVPSAGVLLPVAAWYGYNQAFGAPGTWVELILVGALGVAAAGGAVLALERAAREALTRALRRTEPGATERMSSRSLPIPSACDGCESDESRLALEPRALLAVAGNDRAVRGTST